MNDQGPVTTTTQCHLLIPARPVHQVIKSGARAIVCPSVRLLVNFHPAALYHSASSPVLEAAYSVRTAGPWAVIRTLCPLPLTTLERPRRDPTELNRDLEELIRDMTELFRDLGRLNRVRKTNS